ncbi:hypothetical protein BC829DRAFT_265162 [Chytridium lagenaria]|nr:hypothetical protein BC829DRAFT_265162 [Chytridium lagenaria]
MSSTLHHRSSPTTATAARSGSSVTSDQQQQKHQQQHPQYNLSTTSSASLHPASSSTSSFALKPTTSSSGLSSASEVDIPDIPAAQSSTHLPPKSFDILRALTCCFHCRKTNIVGSSAVRSRPPRGPIENVRVHIRRNDHGRTVVKTSLVMKPGTMGRRLFSQEDVDEYEYEDDVFDQNDGRRPMGSLGDKRGVPPPLLVDSSSQSPFLGSEEEPSTKIMDDKTNDSMSITSIARSVADDFEAEMETIMKMFAEALKGLPEPMLTRYQFKGLLGYGGNGFVADCVDNETGMEIAVKFIPKSRISHDSLVHSNEFGCAVPLEAQILRSIQHPNIISLVFFHECEKFVYIGMEKAKKLTWRLSDDHPTMVTVDMTTGRIIDDIDYDSALPQPMEPGPPTLLPPSPVVSVKSTAVVVTIAPKVSVVSAFSPPPSPPPRSSATRPSVVNKSRPTRISAVSIVTSSQRYLRQPRSPTVQ